MLEVWSVTVMTVDIRSQHAKRPRRIAVEGVED